MHAIVGHVLEGVSGFGRALAELICPRRCSSCATPLDSTSHGVLCARCEAKLPTIGEFRCSRCGHPTGLYAEIESGCGSCGPLKSLMFRKAVGVLRYDGVAREMIHGLKYRSDLGAGRYLAEFLVRQLEAESFMQDVQLVLPVPLHWFRRLRRGLNQAEMPARAISRAFGIPMMTGNLRRIRNTASQTSLTQVQRTENIRGAFRVGKPAELAGKTVLLVDDVVTTCATASECARTLRLAGAKAVYVASLAR